MTRSRRGHWLQRTKAAAGRLLAFVLAAGLPLTAAAQVEDPPSRVGRISAIDGRASVAGPDGNWAAAERNFPVAGGMAFMTEPRSRLELRVGPDALRLDGASEIEIGALDDRVLNVRVIDGTLGVRIADVQPGESYQFVTPRGRATLTEPGRFRFEAGSESEPTRIAVLEGAALVEVDQGSRWLRAGESAVLTGIDRFDLATEPASRTEFDRWAAARDSSERGRVAQRYVPPAMTGYEDLDAYGNWREEAEYGPVWYPNQVPADWAPYRDGRWAWVEPWGWTWIDESPWGFAPSHYGRWVQVNEAWGWAPGAWVERPVYAPALVAFVGSPGISIGIGIGPAVAWFPLGFYDRYRPYYPCSTVHVRRVNHYRHFDVPGRWDRHDSFVHRRHATLVPRDTFVGSHRVRPAVLRFDRDRASDWRADGTPPQRPHGPFAGDRDRRRRDTGPTARFDADGRPLPRSASRTLPALPRGGDAAERWRDRRRGDDFRPRDAALQDRRERREGERGSGRRDGVAAGDLPGLPAADRRERWRDRELRGAERGVDRPEAPRGDDRPRARFDADGRPLPELAARPPGALPPVPRADGETRGPRAREAAIVPRLREGRDGVSRPDGRERWTRPDRDGAIVAPDGGRTRERTGDNARDADRPPRGRSGDLPALPPSARSGDRPEIPALPRREIPAATPTPRVQPAPATVPDSRPFARDRDRFRDRDGERDRMWRRPEGGPAAGPSPAPRAFEPTQPRRQEWAAPQRSFDPPAMRRPDSPPPEARRMQVPESPRRFEPPASARIAPAPAPQPRQAPVVHAPPPMARPQPEPRREQRREERREERRDDRDRRR